MRTAAGSRCQQCHRDPLSMSVVMASSSLSSSSSSSSHPTWTLRRSQASHRSPLHRSSLPSRLCLQCSAPAAIPSHRHRRQWRTRRQREQRHSPPNRGRRRRCCPQGIGLRHPRHTLRCLRGKGRRRRCCPRGTGHRPLPHRHSPRVATHHLRPRRCRHCPRGKALPLRRPSCRHSPRGTARPPASHLGQWSHQSALHCRPVATHRRTHCGTTFVPSDRDLPEGLSRATTTICCSSSWPYGWGLTVSCA
mmetsp:Transcript_4198/g.9200  ORF Transcript_4198/g.9200 Transcript_4198/m.9200 type:complete len:249 (-) Transcript_4198:34-780(-)